MDSAPGSSGRNPYVGLVTLALLAAGGLGACKGHEPRTEIGPGECYLCHQPEYEATVSPPHTAVGDLVFDTGCATCHSTDAWCPTSWADHPWPLDGGHVFSCTDAAGNPRETCGTAGCHRERGDPTGPTIWSGRPTACLGCHEEDHNRAIANFPDHATSFGDSCEQCHNTTDWHDALDGMHPNDRFNITSGNHSGYACTDCHDLSRGPSAGGANTDCVNCHAGSHPRSLMDEHHVGEVSGYPASLAGPYTAPFNELNFCLDCHADGRKGN